MFWWNLAVWIGDIVNHFVSSLIYCHHLNAMSVINAHCIDSVAGNFFFGPLHTPRVTRRIIFIPTAAHITVFENFTRGR
jgi:hypothetical protein